MRRLLISLLLLAACKKHTVEAPAPARPASTADIYPPVRPPAPARVDDVPDLLWHRWCLADGGEEWTLVGGGRPLAYDACGG